MALVNAFSSSVPNSMCSGNLNSIAPMSLSSSVFMCSRNALYVFYVASLCNITGPKTNRVFRKSFFCIFLPDHPLIFVHQCCHIVGSQIERSINANGLIIRISNEMLQVKYPASKEYGTHMGPRWVIIWVLYGQPIWDRCGFCNRDSSGTHLGTSIWAPYGPHVEFPI